MLTPYGKREWLIILAGGLALTAGALALRWWIAAGAAAAVMLALLSFFRDPRRVVPIQRGVMVAVCDGVVSSIHRVEQFAPFGGEPALCIRVFMSVLNVHVNRAPCHGAVTAITPKPGRFMNAMNPASADVNESNLVVLVHPTQRYPVAAVRQVAGAIARTIVCAAKVGQILQRGEKFGMIKFGSTTELYIPERLQPQVAVQPGQKVSGAVTVLAQVTPAADEPDAAAPGPVGAESCPLPPAT